jgi:hypothetical protein
LGVQNALARELRTPALLVTQQPSIVVIYHGIIVGDCAEYLLDEDGAIVELESTKAATGIRCIQHMNYLRDRWLARLSAAQFRNSAPRDQAHRSRFVIEFSYRRSCGAELSLSLDLTPV